MSPEQVVFLMQWQVALIRFIGLESLLRPFVKSCIYDGRYATRYLAAARVYLARAPAVRPDGLLRFADDQNADISQIHQYIPDDGVPPDAVFELYLFVFGRLLLEPPGVGRGEDAVFRQFVGDGPQAHIQFDKHVED